MIRHDLERNMHKGPREGSLELEGMDNSQGNITYKQILITVLYIMQQAFPPSAKK